MAEKQELKFSEATLLKVEEMFGLERDLNRQLPAFLAWEESIKSQTINEIQTINLAHLQRILNIGVGGWNEVELESKFIAPLFGIADYDDGTVGYFMERSLEAEIEGKKLFGNVDGMISRGQQDPRLPYFCMQEFKRSQDSSGRADGQTLAAMLAAQALNENRFPIYGLYIIGVTWHFMVLEGKQYTISKSYGADSEDLDNIFKMLKALKVIILKQIAEEEKS